MIKEVELFCKLKWKMKMHSPNLRECILGIMHKKVDFLGGCRPIIGFDGCHLKGRFMGQILVVTIRDANDNVFPFAFAVVE